MHPRDLVADGVTGAITDLLDLVLARACLDCAEPGRVLCRACLGRLRGQPMDLTGPRGLPVVAALPYDTDGRRLVLAYKERGLRALAPMLGTLLADTVVRHIDGAGARRVALVPVPAHRRARRGFDALGGIVAPAVRDLRRRGLVATVHRPVAARSYPALKDLGRTDRVASVSGAFRLTGPILAAGGDLRIVVDDVLTTGATTGELARTLARAGLAVHGIAVLTAVEGHPATGRAQPG